MKNKYINLVVTLLLITSSVFAQSTDFCNDFPSRIPEIPRIPINPGTPPPTRPTPIPPTAFPLAPDPIIFWTHGYGGGDNSWSKPMGITGKNIPNTHPNYAGQNKSVNELISYPARKVICAGAGFSLGNDLVDIGSYVDDEIRNFAQGKGQTAAEARMLNFCIAHSFGGLAVRQADVIASHSENDPFYAGGIITFGTVHHGAVLANNVFKDDVSLSTPELAFETQDLKQTSMFKNFVSSAEHNVSSGPAAEIEENLLLNSSLPTFVVNRLDGVITSAISAFISATSSLVPLVIGGFFNRTGLDLQVGSQNLVALQASPNSTVNVACYGTEDDDLRMWKTLYWIRNSPQNPARKTPEAQGYFEAGYDDVAVTIFNDNLSSYESKVRFWKKKARDYKSWQWSKKRRAEEVARQFEKGVRWFQRSTDNWDRMTGALYSASGTACNCGGTVVHDGPCNSDDPEYCDTEVTSSVYIVKGTDGITLTESTIDFPGLVREPFHMDGSGHFQMRNDFNTKSVLLTILTPTGLPPSLDPLSFFHREAKPY